jgi:hypothetical protein
MKKLICFLMMATMTVASVSTLVQAETLKTKTVQTVELSDIQLSNSDGSLRSVGDCAILIIGLGIGGGLIGGGWGALAGAGVGALFCAV